MVRREFLILLTILVVVSLIPLGLSKFYKSDRFAGCRSLSATGEIDPSETLAIWQNRPITPLLALNDSLSVSQKQVLGASTADKWIEVDLSDQKLTAHQGETIVLESLISSGLTHRTPTGEYRIWYKTRATKMEGGNKLDNSYYYLPNVPYVMYFNGDVGIHGTYWHSDFGRPKSHGCVNTPTSVAEKLYYWTDPQLPAGKNFARSTPTNPGTRVVVHP